MRYRLLWAFRSIWQAQCPRRRLADSRLHIHHYDLLWDTALMWLSNVSLPHFFLNECCLIGGVLDLTPWGCLKSIKRSFWPKVCSWCRPGGRYSNLLVKTLRFAQGEQSFGTAPNILRVPPRRSHSGASHLRGLKFKLRSWTYITHKGIGWAMSWSPWRLGNKIKRLCL